MLFRSIPTLLSDDGDLVKSKKFKNNIYVGDPLNAVRIFNEKEVDELIFLDISATRLNKDPDFDKIDTVIKQVDLQSLTNDLEHGIHAQISENGANLSGGQKQRIGLARALYRESKILLLDEFTSSLDKKTEQNILKSLLKLKNQNISMIMVSHKTEPLEICDRIYELQNGQFSDK